MLNVFSSGILKGLQSLQILTIRKCDALEVIFDLEGINDKEIDYTATIQLRELYVSHLKSLTSVWDKDLKGLLTFQNLWIISCGMEAIVANENEDETTPLFLFPQLTTLLLESLHQLKRFCSGRFSSKLPLLKKLKVCNCDKVEVLFQEISLEGELDNKIQQLFFLIKKKRYISLEFFKFH